MNEGVAVLKSKKSVALSGVPAGNTALCTVGRNGNDLHYRGYDIVDLAANCEFEEIAYLLLYGKLPTAQELDCYRQRLSRLRGLPHRLAPCRSAVQGCRRACARHWSNYRQRPIRWMFCAPESACWRRWSPSRISRT